MTALKSAEPIVIRRRETITINLVVTEGTLYEGDKFIFSVRRGADSALPYVLKKEIAYGETGFTLTSAETEALAKGAYYYDIWLQEADGTMTPVCAPTTFEVREAIYNG